MIILSLSSLQRSSLCTSRGFCIIYAMQYNTTIEPHKVQQRKNHQETRGVKQMYFLSPAARGGNLAKIPPNQVIDDFGRGSSVESESE